MKYIPLLLAVLLTGCLSTAPKFPDYPEGVGMNESCPDLKKLKDDPVLSDVSKTINDNYGSYWTCAVKVDTWIEWYGKQKLIYDKAVK